MIRIDLEKCIRCGSCVRDCPVHVLSFDAHGSRTPQVRKEDAAFCLNCLHCLAVCPAGAVSCHGKTPESCLTPGGTPDPALMMNLIRQRRSIRRYKPQPVSPDVLEQLCSALSFCPTGCNDRSLSFTVVSPESMAFFRAQIQRIMKLLIWTGILKLFYPKISRFLEDIRAGKDVIFRDAPHMVIASVSRKAPCKEADPWIALSYFDLLAQTHGLGSCWCGFAVYAFRLFPSLRRRLNLPEGHRVSAVLLFGYPDVAYARIPVPKPYPVTNLK